MNVATTATPTRRRRGRLVLVLAAAALAAWPTGAAAAPGDLDPAFDRDGKLTFGSGYVDEAYSVLVQPDRKIAVAGSGGANTDLMLTRLSPDGAFDGSFGATGRAFADFGDTEYGYAAAQQRDGKIVVAGYTPVNKDIAVARFNPDGSLDASFDPGGTGGSGRKTIDYGGDDSPDEVLVQPDGKILIAGSGGPGTSLAVTRLNQDGSFDTSFFGDATALADFGGVDYGLGAALQPDGKIVIAGYTSVGADVAVARFNPGGPAGKALDDTFNGDGRKTIDYGGADEADAVAVQPDGRIVLAGRRGAIGNHDFAVTRLNPDGSLDTSFDFDGTSGADLGGNDLGWALALQPNGKIVVAGQAAAGMRPGFAALRLQPGGSLDSTFGFDGKATLDFGNGANALALQPDGKIVLAGNTSVDNDVAVARLEGDPPAGSGPGGRGVETGSGTAVPRCSGRRATIVGTAGRDVLRGTRGADVIVALAGDDRITAAGGNDLVCGGAGDDRLAGERGRDRLLGGSGDDLLAGGPGNDRLFGGPGSDRLPGGPGDDLLAGQAGRDRLLGGPGADRLAGGTGSDRLPGGPGDDRLAGGPGADRLAGGGGRDHCRGGGGRDRTRC